MQSVSLRHLLIAGLVLIFCAVGLWAVFNSPEDIEEPSVVEEVIPEEPFASVETIGSSVDGRDITAYHYGTGDTELLFVGGIHGGYEWNSSLLAYEFIDHIEAHPEIIPEAVSVTIVPVLNPDGLFAVIGREGRFVRADVPADEGLVGTGRFNANSVDLNRNFDCKWQPESQWRGNVVSAGTGPFSEPEAAALRDLVLERNPVGVTFWHSQAGAVYASECLKGVLPETEVLMNTYAIAAGYPSVLSFDAYPVTGDAEGWLASIGIPAVSVELSTHETLEWEQNLAGFEAVLNTYAK